MDQNQVQDAEFTGDYSTTNMVLINGIQAISYTMHIVLGMCQIEP